jgi:hypothetical protein
MTEARRHPSPGAERSERWIRRLLLWAGVVEMALGALHFALPYAAYQSKGFSSLRPEELSFVTLVILAVGILLLAFGAFTAYLASRTAGLVELLFFYSLIKAFLWAGRVILELAYPIRLRLFFVEPFTAVAVPVLLLELLLFVASAVLARRAVVAGVADGNVLTG